MRRWYMVLFRQYIEWSIMNTGVILRERPGGKKRWTGLNLKMAIAEQLAFLGRGTDQPQTQQIVTFEPLSDDDVEEAGQSSAKKLWLSKKVCHVPIEQSSRRECRVHKQRKMTRFFCSTCKKALCLGECWERYHSKTNYLWLDPNCKGKVINNKKID